MPIPQDPRPQQESLAQSQGNETTRAQGQQQGSDGPAQGEQKQNPFEITLPKGGGAIQGIGEKFQANPVTGTGSMSVPIAMTPGRGGFAPQLALSYDSGGGNSAFGLGWNIGVPRISRKTSKGLPQYDGLPSYADHAGADVFLLSGAEDLVPELDAHGERLVIINTTHEVHRYRPRIEGLFARIEKWVSQADGDTHWRSITKENITTLYGETVDSRIADPDKPHKVFTWLISRSYDDKGNVIHYQYKAEDGAGNEGLIYEKNRTVLAQKYLKRVLYGNTLPFTPLIAGFDETIWKPQNEFLFELVIDYGEHDLSNLDQAWADSGTWSMRPDAFSSYRSGFEIRSYRLCRNILMFHNMPDKLSLAHTLVKATHLDHDLDPVASKLLSVEHTGYQYHADGSWTHKSVPAVLFGYTAPKIDHKVYEIKRDDLPNVPQGIDGSRYRFVDLHGEGLSGILAQRDGGWYYKRNEGDGNFGAARLEPAMPSLGTQAQPGDYGGNGLTDLVVQNQLLKGYFEMDEEQNWQPFRSFTQIPNISPDDPNLRQIDLNGDGIPDLLLTEHDCFVWYPSQGKEGHEAARRVSKALDEEQGPRIVFQEAFQTIHLADMSGDGLTDIVRVRNGEIVYWPNLGYGRFGAKVTMADAPHFDFPDYFDPARIRLADIDGSGTTDIMYLGRDVLSYWLNQSGNRWSTAQQFRHFPKTTNLDTVSVFDLLGNGTACIVWSSPLPAQAHTPMKYIQLMGADNQEGHKPYLLKEINNQMGAITRLKYEASTRFYLDDRKAGKPWITKLPFPVQVLVRQEVFDEISQNHFVSRYAYHHGYFDKAEREFRGFGMVEQWDTEDFASFKNNSLFPITGNNWEEDSFIPPVYTKSWFHNGYWQLGGKISRQYEAEYYAGDSDAWALPDSALPADLNAQETREAARTLKGSVLRVETYALDKSSKAEHPYSVAETSYHIRAIQNQGPNRHAVFYSCNCETLTYHYERNPADPRIAHQSTLETDAYGNVLKAATIAYPRRSPAYPEQGTLHVLIQEADFINSDAENGWYRLGTGYAQRSYELTGMAYAQERLDKAALISAVSTATTIAYETIPDSSMQMRLLASAYNTFSSEDLLTELPQGQLAYHAIPCRSYQMAGTDAMWEAAKEKSWRSTSINAPNLTPTMWQDAGYIQQNAAWWQPSPRTEHDASRFFLPVKQIDLFGQELILEYDTYNLALTASETSIHGKVIRTTAELDYRLMQPRLVTDPNGNRSEAVFDEMGAVVAVAVMGKLLETDPAMMGDSLSGFAAIPEPVTTDLRADIIQHPYTYLKHASQFFYYDLFAWQRDGSPPYALSIAREQHVLMEDNGPSPVQITVGYSDGFGQEIMTKAQAEPGEARYWDEVNQIVAVQDTSPNLRWIGNGRTVFNNKGKPVKQYEPYFSLSADYESEDALVEYGVTPIIHYDPVGRAIRTDMPDGTFTKVEFDPWQQASFDQNDTVKESQWYYDRGAPTSEPSNDYDGRAAWLATAHDNTPKVEYLDVLGRVFLLEDQNIDDQGNVLPYHTRFTLDVQGQTVGVTDALSRLITVNSYDMLGQPLFTDSIDAGYRWSFTTADGQPAYGWNERNFRSRMSYDALRRPLGSWLSEQGAAEELVGYTIYGELHPQAESLNLLGAPFQVFDQSGRMTSEAIDFKGNPLRSSQRLCSDYKNRINWTSLAGNTQLSQFDAVADMLLESEQFSSAVTYDALSRPLKQRGPDGSIQQLFYNEAGLLERITLDHKGSGNINDYVKNIDYDEKGQRTRIRYGNDVVTRYDYDPESFRLIRLLSTRNSGSEVLQDIRYHYDPVGNITDMRDEAQQTFFFQNSQVEPHSSYTYDALYRLLAAKGREQTGQQAQPAGAEELAPIIGVPDANNSANLRRYIRSYTYDAMGNIQRIDHKTASGTGNFTRRYQYASDNNYLLGTSAPGDLAGGPYARTYSHDVHGNMTAMPHLPTMHWDFLDQLKEVDLPGGGKEYYTYTLSGGKDFGVRSRKVTQRGNTIKERIYIGDFEIYREYSPGGLQTERDTLHMQDDKGRIALLDTLNIDNGLVIASGQQSIARYQLNNHLGSASLDLDDTGQIITYEEYYPFGASSYRTGKSAAEVSAKRYRYVGKEKDEATGLYYYGARYYADWLARFVSVDDLKDRYPFYTPYQYAGNKPVSFIDLDGLEELPPQLLEYQEYQKIKASVEGLLRPVKDFFSKRDPTFTIKVINQFLEITKEIEPSFYVKEELEGVNNKRGEKDSEGLNREINPTGKTVLVDEGDGGVDTENVVPFLMKNFVTGEGPENYVFETNSPISQEVAKSSFLKKRVMGWYEKNKDAISRGEVGATVDSEHISFGTKGYVIETFSDLNIDNIRDFVGGFSIDIYQLDKSTVYVEMFNITSITSGDLQKDIPLLWDTYPSEKREGKSNSPQPFSNISQTFSITITIDELEKKAKDAELLQLFENLLQDINLTNLPGGSF